MNVLFICSRNQWRSPTAEQVWRQMPGLQVRSAGTSPQARRPVTEKDIRWAEVIFVMEPKHRQRLQAEFRQSLDHKRVEVLHIPDDYQFMDPELVEIFQSLAHSFIAENSEPSDGSGGSH
jgi:predicted protein tyrosine phosphatase